MKGKMEETLAKESFGAIKEDTKQTIDEIRQNMEDLRENKKIRSAEKIAVMKEKMNGRKNSQNK
jgi:hypothetical protein